MQSDEALALGIFNRVVDDEDLPQHVLEITGAIASGPPVALRFMKENFNRAINQDLITCMAMEADQLIRSANTDDHGEG